MTIKFQRARVDPGGSPDWTPGKEDYDTFWEVLRDRARFHRGEKFTIETRPDGAKETRPLSELKDELLRRLKNNPADTRFIIRSIKDNWANVVRKHDVVEGKGIQVITVARSLVATPYIFGVTDCSWLSKESVNEVVPSIDLPHNAHLQHISEITVEIPRAKILPGDLLFHHGDDHVSIYEGTDNWSDGAVWDTEPHDTWAPRGWPTTMLGTGVRRRPMTPGYYCSWEGVNAIGRIVAINGQP